MVLVTDSQGANVKGSVNRGLKSSREVLKKKSSSTLLFRSVTNQAALVSRLKYKGVFPIRVC